MVPSRFAAWLTVNRQCNLRCAACYAQASGFGGSMSSAIADRAVTFLSELPVENVFLIGGEPTIHPEFLRIVELVSQHGMKPTVITNGLAFADETYLHRAIVAGLRGITTSVKAPDNETYRRFTGISAFQRIARAVRNLERAKSATMFHKVSITIYRDLFDSLDSMMDTLDTWGVEMVSFDLERPWIATDGSVNAGGSALPKELAAFLVAAYPRMLTHTFRFNIKIGLPLCLFPDEFLRLLAERNQLVTGCQIFDGKGIVIDERGNILPCNHFCGHPFAHLSQFSTGQAYLDWRATNPTSQAFYQTIGNYRTERCVTCDQWQYCGGGCIVRWLHFQPDQMIPAISGSHGG